MVGEVFNWGVDGFKNTVKNSRAYNYGDKQVDFFNYGFDALINMGFVSHVSGSAEQLFSTYSTKLHSQELQGVGILNYISSHDDESSYDRQRNETYEAAFKLMLAPGGVQIYYGDELARPLYADKNVFGDAHLRTVMNWQDLNNKETQDLLAHWQKLGRFRQGNTVVGAGTHTKLQDAPYIFKRSLAGQNNVLVANGLEAGKKSIPVYNTFEDGTVLKDHYSNQIVEVINGHVTITSKFTYLLLAINN
jgi:alpha-amylase